MTPLENDEAKGLIYPQVLLNLALLLEPRGLENNLLSPALESRSDEVLSHVVLTALLEQFREWLATFFIVFYRYALRYLILLLLVHIRQQEILFILQSASLSAKTDDLGFYSVSVQSFFPFAEYLRLVHCKALLCDYDTQLLLLRLHPLRHR